MINPLRHLDVFSPEKFGSSKVAIIGCGATGSAVALQLAKLGVRNIHLWDDDEVADHNLANQMFKMSDVGRKKVNALADVLKDFADLDATVHDCRVEGGERDLGQYVFVLTDTMSSRKEIFDKSIRLNPSCRAMIETRMSADMMMVYAINPISPNDIAEYAKTLYDDEQTETTTACGASTTVVSTATILAGMAVWEFIRRVNRTNETHESILTLNPLELHLRNFKL